MARWLTSTETRWGDDTEKRWWIGNQMPLYHETTTLTSDQLLNLDTVYPELTPAPPEGHTIIPLWISVTHNFGSAYYVPYVGHPGPAPPDADNMYFTTQAEWEGPNGGYWGLMQVDVFGSGSPTESPVALPAMGTEANVLKETVEGEPLVLLKPVAMDLGDGTATIEVVYGIGNV